MPIRTRLHAAPVVTVDAASAFRWSDTGDGLTHALGDPCFSTRAAAERAWQRVRREVWSTTHRFNVPDTATIYDGVTATGLVFVRHSWNQRTIDLVGARAALAVDRANLERFAGTKAARSIRDYLDLFRTDLDTVEQTAANLAAWTGEYYHRPYPAHLNTASTYGADRVRPPRGMGDDLA